jgi:hypothetical protein
VVCVKLVPFIVGAVYVAGVAEIITEEHADGQTGDANTQNMVENLRFIVEGARAWRAAW